MIHFDEATGIFYLQTPGTSYVLQIYREGVLAHLYYGKTVAPQDFSPLRRDAPRSFSPTMPGTEPDDLTLDELPQEYPTFGLSDLRAPALHARYADGSRLTDLRYASHRIRPGKPRRAGLPGLLAGDGDAQTLEITLRDRRGLLEVVLSYTVYDDVDVISRGATIRNSGRDALVLQEADSLCLDLPDCEFELVELQGAWARERQLEARRLAHGAHLLESRRGASGHQIAPFLALKRPDAGEEFGEVYGLTLVYSGSFAIRTEVDSHDATRVTAGIDPFDFSWKLEPGESFETPEALLTFSDAGLGGMSRAFHRACRRRLGHSRFRDESKPIILNSWEAAYFDFDTERLQHIIRSAAGLGIDVFVLDDGWFGARDDNTSSLGDWTVNEAKLPGGLDPIIRTCRENGMRFGIWFEPEMISENSDLYRAHPDWCLHVPGVPHCRSRNQLTLDLSRPDVVDYLERAVGAILSAHDVAYVKWDMNRNMSNVGSALLPPDRQGEVRHRYLLGLYDLMERLTTRFPDVLFEGCSGGGGRMDYGILYYMPQYWTSDNSDAVSRLKIQYGSSLFLPPCTMVGHVSACPNHQVGRETPLQTRADVAAFCNFGYELDPARLNDAERAAIRAQTARQRRLEPLVRDGDFYRLRDPFAGNEAAWMLVSLDRSEAVALYARVLAVCNAPTPRLRLRGLDPAARYHVDELGCDVGGDLLMQAGLPIEEAPGDFRTWFFTLHRVGDVRA